MKNKRFPLIAEGVFPVSTNKLAVCFTEEHKGVQELNQTISTILKLKL